METTHVIADIISSCSASCKLNLSLSGCQQLQQNEIFCEHWLQQLNVHCAGHQTSNSKICRKTPVWAPVEMRSISMPKKKFCKQIIAHPHTYSQKKCEIQLFVTFSTCQFCYLRFGQWKCERMKGCFDRLPACCCSSLVFCTQEELGAEVPPPSFGFSPPGLIFACYGNSLQSQTIFN